MPSAAVKIVQPKLLLVEGKDEVNFFTAVLQRHLNLSGIQLIDCGGKTRLSAFLRTLAADSAFPSVLSMAVIRDADQTAAGATITAAASAFDSVRGSLTAPGVALSCPAGHAQFAPGPPRVGVFIMPDGTSDGMLETLCMRAVSAWPEYGCMTDFFACCQRFGVVPNNLHKAHAHAWLASRAESDKRVGEAALAGYWPFAEPAFQPLWDFLNGI